MKDPGSLVMLYQEASNNGNNVGSRMHSYPLYQDLQQRAAPLAEVFCRRTGDASISIDNQTERVDVELVSGNYFVRWVFARPRDGYSTPKKTIRCTTATRSSS